MRHNLTIDIICPLYNAEDYIKNLQNALANQKNVKIHQILYVITKSSDQTEAILKKLHASYQTINQKDFSHSLTREKAALASQADIVCFITQDIIIQDDYWLEKLVQPIISGVADAAYSRQISEYSNIEKYTRESNYPAKSSIKSKKDIPKLGLNTFFFSDAASAVKLSTFKKLDGYDHKKLPISEDMYLAYKIIMSGGKIAYQADSVVYHSHNFSLRELYARYKLTGQFMRQNSYLDQYGTTSSGGKMAKYILKRAIQDRNLRALLRYPFDMAARLIGMKVGQRTGHQNR